MTGLSFPKEERLLKPADFERARKAGKKVHLKNFLVYVLPNNFGQQRLGLIVGSHVGGAVKRNRIKRFLREYFRLNKEKFPPSSDIIISARKEADPGSFKDLEAEFSSLKF